MRLTTISVLVLALMVGCSKKAPEPASGGGSGSGGGTPAAPAPKIYAKGEEAPAGGEVSHKILAFERMETIPASRALESWKEAAQDTPAPDGMVWVYLKGATTNKGKDKKSVKSISVTIFDENDKEYSLSTDTTWFADPPCSLDVNPGKTEEWAAFYKIPKGSKKLVFVGTDLKFVPDATCKIRLD